MTSSVTKGPLLRADRYPPASVASSGAPAVANSILTCSQPVHLISTSKNIQSVNDVINRQRHRCREMINNFQKSIETASIVFESGRQGALLGKRRSTCLNKTAINCQYRHCILKCEITLPSVAMSTASVATARC